ncbi:MAG TPA: MIP/aquaporin family protein [Bacillus sp. (in: firmicutes)]|uniref:MIP/aquaporin family protein n=1 Tax=Bacillus litorisediminis TaxID=2922713 RepID=UPI001FABB1F0|nr:MIP/aquaporin family protein [Bacillus litorisediminis]HWO76291.1 MIP/aquaporin family protein [Bacillus sp. (in: firmicutes)]
MSEFLAEVIGTMILIIFGGGVVAGVVLKKTKAEGAGWIVITVGWGLAVTMAIYAVGSISGAHLNPAVTLGFAAIGEFPWEKVPAFISAQMLGAFIGAVIVYLLYLPHWSATEDKGAKLGVFSTGPAIRSPLSNLVSEVIGTFILIFGLLFIGTNQFTEGLNPLVVGLLITAIGLSLGAPTGYAINPARDLGPRIAHALLPIVGKGNSDWEYSWIPVVGPILGGVYGALFYKALFQGDYSVSFWIASVIVAVIFIAAATQETKKASVTNHTNNASL